MLESLVSNSEMTYTKLSPEELSRRGILGRLTGIIADFKKPTRNGRNYTESLWEKVFNSPIMKEKLENKCCFGELGHPEDREEVDMEKIAICLAEPPKKGKDGKLYGVFDILSTPNGKILKTLCDYGCKIGVSSRGSGDTYTDMNGNETVDEDTYNCVCWDAVLIPAVKDARMNFVTESYNGKKSLTESLLESIDNSNDIDRDVMIRTVKELNLIDSSKLTEKYHLHETVETKGKPFDNIESKRKHLAVDNNLALIEELLTALDKNREYERLIVSLQEKLSVSYTKDAENRSKLEDYSKSYNELSKKSSKLPILESKLKQSDNEIKKLNRIILSQDNLIQSMTEQLQSDKDRKVLLRENLKSKSNDMKILNELVESLLRLMKDNNFKYKNTVKNLNETIDSLKEELKSTNTEYSTKLESYSKEIDKYKSIATRAVDRYINSKAQMLGLSSQEIKNRLPKGYTFSSIDSICEELLDYNIRLNKLPFSQLNENMTVKVNPSKKEPLKPMNGYDDEVDELLLGLAGFNR